MHIHKNLLKEKYLMHTVFHLERAFIIIQFLGLREKSLKILTGLQKSILMYKTQKMIKLYAIGSWSYSHMETAIHLQVTELQSLSNCVHNVCSLWSVVGATQKYILWLYPLLNKSSTTVVNPCCGSSCATAQKLCPANKYLCGD